MFFVAGITGQVGSATARHLLERGKQIRALVRDPQKAAGWSQKGVEVRGGDPNDAAVVTAALEGVEGAFLMMLPTLAPTPGFPRPSNQTTKLHLLRCRYCRRAWFASLCGACL